MLEVRAAANPLNSLNSPAIYDLFERLQDQRQSTLLVPLRHFATQAHALVDLALLLQRQAGSPVSHGAIQATCFPHVWRLAFEMEEPQIGQVALEIALCLFNGLDDRANTNIEPHLERLRHVVDVFSCGNTTRALMRAATQRDIPVVRMDQESLLLLGQGKRQHRLQTAMTDRTSHVAEGIARDKQLTKRLLAKSAFPSLSAAWLAMPKTPFAPLLKLEPPWSSSRGIPISAMALHSTSPIPCESVALPTGRIFSTDVIVERFLPGEWHRLLVAGREMVAAVRERHRESLEMAAAQLRN